MNRFFVSNNNINEDKNEIILDDKEEIKHISRVLRLDINDTIEICNNDSIEYICEIKKIDKEKIECRIIDKYTSKAEPPIELVLFQGIPKSNKMDLIIQKCVELGVKKIVPILTDRCVVKINDSKSENKKIERWNRIALEAAKQSKRGYIPKVDEIHIFNKLQKYLSEFDLIILPYENEENKSLKRIIKNNSLVKKIAVIIGPEGGFNHEEVIKSLDWGAVSVTLGPRILRTETAGFVTASILLYELGNLGGN